MLEEVDLGPPLDLDLPARGVLASRLLRALTVARTKFGALDAFIEHRPWYGDGETVKAAVDALTTGTVLGGLIAADFHGRVFADSILGRAGSRIRRVPFNTPLVRQLTGATAQWVQEGHGKPVQGATFGQDLGLPIRKVASLYVQSAELARYDFVDSWLSADLADACRLAVDTAFIDTANVGSGTEMPASISSGGTLIPSSGTGAIHVRADLGALFRAYRGRWDSAVLVCHPSVAVAIALLQQPLGLAILSMGGEGTLFGPRLVVSDAVPLTSSASSMTLFDASAIQFAVDDSVGISVSTAASVEMQDDPEEPTAATLRSLYQSNCVGVRAELRVNWRATGNADRVVSITDCDYEFPT